MGHFRLNLLAVGGHGCQREIGNGEPVVGCDRPNCPDCILREAIRRLKRSGVQLFRAELTHWPADEPNLGYSKENEVRDDLLTGKRSGEFSEAGRARAEREGWSFPVKVRGGQLDGLSTPITVETTEMTVEGVLARILGVGAPAKKADGTNATYDYVVQESAGAGQTQSRIFRLQTGSAYPLTMKLFPTIYDAVKYGAVVTAQMQGDNPPIV